MFICFLFELSYLVRVHAGSNAVEQYAERRARGTAYQKLRLFADYALSRSLSLSLSLARVTKVPGLAVNRIYGCKV